MASPRSLAHIARMGDLVRQRRLMDAAILAEIAEMDREDTAKDTGYTRLPVLLAEILHITRGAATRLVRRAEQITEVLAPTGHVMPAPLPAMRAAVLAGLVDGEHLDEVTKAMKALPATVSVANREVVEATLAGTAEVADPTVVVKHAVVLLDRFNPDGTEPPHDEPEPRNLLTYQRTGDGGMDFRGHVERECAEVFEKLLHAFGAPQPDEQRSRKRRLGDAMVEVIDAASHAVEVPTAGGERPRLVAYLDLNVLIDAVGTATLDSGCALSAAATRRLACDAEIIPLVMSGESVPLDLGRAHRVVTHHQRTALTARDKGCAFPTCTAPASWCDAHHVIHVRHEARVCPIGGERPPAPGCHSGLVKLRAA